MTRKITQTEFVKRVHDKHPDFLILSLYTKMANNVTVKSSKCGHIWRARAHNLVNGTGCPICNGHHKLTQKEFTEKLYKVNPHLKVIGEYIKESAKVEVQCLKCKRNFYSVAGSLLEGTGCPYCAHNQNFTQNEFIKKLHEKHPKIIALSSYINAHHQMWFQCLKCNTKWKTEPCHILYETGCPKCSSINRGKKQILTQKEFVKRVHTISPYLKILSVYQGMKKSIHVLDTRCGHDWWTVAESIIQGSTCPRCSLAINSHGEAIVAKYLARHHYLYKSQYAFNDCCYKKPLPFDFAVFNHDNSLNCLIEYQGSQHFLTKRDLKHTCFYKSIDDLEIAKKRDEIKKTYCSTHHIHLIYINHYPSMSNHIKFIQQLVDTTLDQQFHVA